MLNYIEKKTCRACLNKNLKQVLDLNTQPLANSYHEGQELEEFPLALNVCSDCFHLQLNVVVDPDLMFKNYLYVSGTSKTLNEYFDKFVDICEKYVTSSGSVLDIACNDGTQLSKFKERGWDTFGVDPAVNLYELSSKNHNIVCDYWAPAVANAMERKFDVLIAQNVFAHVNDVRSFLKACSMVMDERSRLFIQTSQADMVENNEFDTIYHEHLSFFNTKSMKYCANINGFSLVDVFKTDVHGGSYVFVLALGARNESKADKMLAAEDDLGLYTIDTYEKYAEKCREVTTQLVQKVNEFRSEGCKVVGYGAAAKGNTLLNFAGLDLDYIVDDNEMKWDLFTPGRNILIKDPICLKAENAEKLVIVPLAWNFFKEIREKAVKVIGSEIKFIKYFPEVKVL